MPLKGFVRELQDIRDGIGSISMRNIDVKIFPLQRARSQVDHSTRQALRNIAKYVEQKDQEQSRWVGLPPELIRDVICRVEESEDCWPSRRNVIVCASVCKTWRDATKELVTALEQSGKITFPISLKQPGPRNAIIQCFIKRDRAAAIYRLYLGLTPTLAENGKFLLAAKRFRHATSTDYIISLDASDMSQGSHSCFGKLRSNFLATKFTIHDSQSSSQGVTPSSSKGMRCMLSRQSSSRVTTGINTIAHISYELNVLGTRGPRRMQCLLDSIPVSVMQEGGSVATLTDEMPNSSFMLGTMGTDEQRNIAHNTPLILKNKAPRWHEQLQCWCLNFRGRVTVASVKNFQLVAAIEPPQVSSPSEHDKVLLQFGKVGKDTFTMDYRYPLSAFQSFAICLSSFDTKLACE